MFSPGPNEAELKRWGFTIDDYPDEIVDVWPENSVAVDLFQRVCDQWRMGMNGPVSLDMNVPISLAQRMELGKDEFFSLIDDIQLMGLEALKTLRESADET